MTPCPKPTPRPPAARKRIPRTVRPRTRRPLGTVRREAKAAGDLTPEQWEAIEDFYRDYLVVWCAYCELAMASQQDHVRPLSKGGLHTASNVVPSCARCNYRKGASVRWKPKRAHLFMEQPGVTPPTRHPGMEGR
jgi:5-methylcytosine-specific restriction endonuclease McrA